MAEIVLFSSTYISRRTTENHIAYLDLGLSSRLVSSLRGFSVHVHISPVLHLAPEHLGPGPEPGLQTHAQDPLDLKAEEVLPSVNTFSQKTQGELNDTTCFASNPSPPKTCQALTSMSSLLTQIGRLE